MLLIWQLWNSVAFCEFYPARTAYKPDAHCHVHSYTGPGAQGTARPKDNTLRTILTVVLGVGIPTIVIGLAIYFYRRRKHSRVQVDLDFHSTAVGEDDPSAISYPIQGSLSHPSAYYSDASIPPSPPSMGESRTLLPANLYDPFFSPKMVQDRLSAVSQNPPVPWVAASPVNTVQERHNVTAPRLGPTPPPRYNTRNPTEFAPLTDPKDVYGNAMAQRQTLVAYPALDGLISHSSSTSSIGLAVPQGKGKGRDITIVY